MYTYVLLRLLFHPNYSYDMVKGVYGEQLCVCMCKEESGHCTARQSHKSPSWSFQQINHKGAEEECPKGLAGWARHRVGGHHSDDKYKNRNSHEMWSQS